MIRDEGVVIGEINYMDSSKILTLLTKRHGKITVISKGALRPKSAMGNSASLFCRSEFFIYRGNHFFYSYSANVIELFYELRKSTEKYIVACFLSELCNLLLIDEDESNPKIYEMLIQALRLISKGEADWRVLVPAFVIKVASFLGLRPEIYNCLSCGIEIEKDAYFDIVSGGLLCENCGRFSKKIKLQEINFMKYLLKTKFSELEFHSSAYKVFLLLNEYISYQFEIKKIKSLESIIRLYKTKEE